MSTSQLGPEIESRPQSAEAFADYDNLSGLPRGGNGPLSERAHEPYAEVIFLE